MDHMQFQTELQSGEVIEWTGRPDPRRVFTASDFLLIPFSIMWGGFAIFWETMAVVGDAPLFFKLWGIPFVLIGLYIIVGRFFVIAWEKRRTWYAVTNQRILILTTAFGRRVRSFYYKTTLSQIDKKVSARGRGTLIFAPAEYGGFYGGTGWPFAPFASRRRGRAPGFYDIPDAQQVFDLISRHLRTNG